MAEDRREVDVWERAVATCRQALVDYQSGLLDEDQLRQALYRNGMVVGDSETWLLDIAGGTWRRYNGVTTEQIPAPPGDGEAPQQAFDAATLQQWQRGLRELEEAATPLMGRAGG